MGKADRRHVGPRGGLRASPAAMRGWQWSRGGMLVSVPVRCKREQWYLARGKPADAAHIDRAAVTLCFVHRDETVSERTLALHAVAENGSGGELLGWVQAPEDATHLQLRWPDREQAGLFSEVVLHPVAERDPKCHPLANVPHWQTYQPPFPLERVCLPPALERLGPLAATQKVEVLRPRSASQLARRIRGAAGVLDPAWVAELGLRWADVERLAAESWLIIDLETVCELLNRAGLDKLRLVTHRCEHGIMSARVEYSDVPTRGFALQDVFPYSLIDEQGRFTVRVLRANRAWKRYADEEGFATLLASETPWPKHCGDVLSAARPVGRGELIATDLPWLATAAAGRLLAPRLARHTLRMHLGGPVADDVQYWNRWVDSQIMVRDISDLARRYPPLRAVRWASADTAVAHLGVALPAPAGAKSGRALLIRTGRIDNLAVHPGLPPEALIIFMKMLVREARERTFWARRYLRDLTVVWQFDTAAGLRYVANYASAATVVPEDPKTVTLCQAGGDQAGNAASATETFAEDEGLFGDGSLEYQARLSSRLRTLIERESA